MAIQIHRSNGRRTVEMTVPSFLTEGIESGRARLSALEGQAQALVKDLYERGNQELDQLKDRLPIEAVRERLPLESLRERLPVDDVVDRARSLEDRTRSRAGTVYETVEGRIQKLQERTLALAGVASREQVEGLAKEIDKLSRRIDRLAKGAGAPAKKAPAKKAAAKGGSAGKGTNGKRATGQRRSTSSAKAK